MKVATEDLGNREVLIRVEFDEGEKAEALKEAARIISQEINIPGFRKGKAPYDVVRRVVGEELIYKIAFEEMAKKIYPRLISDLNLDPLGPASLEETSPEPFSIALKVSLKPIVDLGDYRSLRIKKGKTEVSDEELQEALRRLQEERATWVTVERSASQGDLIVADLDIKTSKQEARRENVVLLLDPEEDPVEGFSRNLEGLSPGQEKTFTLEREGEGEEREITFHVKVHEVKEKQLPPLDDEFARSWDFNSLDELKESLRRELLSQKEKAEREKALAEAISTLVENARVEVPPVLIMAEVEDILDEEDRALRQQGLSLELYLKTQGKTLEDYTKELIPIAVERVKMRLVLSKFIEEEKLDVSEEEIDEVLKRFEERVDSRKGKKAVRSSPRFRALVSESLLRGKVESRLMEIMLEEGRDEGESGDPDGD